MADAATPSTPAGKAGESDTDRKLREQVEKLLARPAATSTGSVQLADGRRLDYGVERRLRAGGGRRLRRRRAASRRRP